MSLTRKSSKSMMEVPAPRGWKPLHRLKPSTQGLAGEGALLANVAAEDGQSSDAQRQGEEGLTHGSVDGLPEDEVTLSIVHQVVEVGHEVEGQALHAALQSEGAHGQQHHHRQQAEHHGLIDLLHAVLQAPGDHQHAAHHHQDHEHGHEARLGEHVAKLLAHTSGVQAVEIPLGHFDAVQNEPAGHGGVEHHQQVISRQAKPAVPVPAGALGLQRLEGPGHALLAASAHGKLHHHHRQAHDDQKQQVHHHKGGPAVLAGDVGEPPYVAQPDGAPGGYEQKAQPGGKTLALFHGCKLLLSLVSFPELG